MVSPQMAYDLGAAWYDTRLDVEWQRLDAASMTKIFERFGLTGPFWTLTGDR